jgi:hypothetical protein
MSLLPTRTATAHLIGMPRIPKNRAPRTVLIKGVDGELVAVPDVAPVMQQAVSHTPAAVTVRPGRRK